MRSYETIVVLDSQLEDEPIDREITTVEELITSQNGEIVSTERWGRRKLSYEIKDRQQGFYTLIRYNADQTVPQELDRVCKLNESVLRHMTIRVKKHSQPTAPTPEGAADVSAK